MGWRPDVTVSLLSFADVGRVGLCSVGPMTGAVLPPAGPFLLWSLQVPGWGSGISSRHTRSPCTTQTPRGTRDPLDLVTNADSGLVQGQCRSPPGDGSPPGAGSLPGDECPSGVGVCPGTGVRLGVGVFPVWESAQGWESAQCESAWGREAARRWESSGSGSPPGAGGPPGDGSPPWNGSPPGAGSLPSAEVRPVWESSGSGSPPVLPTRCLPRPFLWVKVPLRGVNAE